MKKGFILFGGFLATCSIYGFIMSRLTIDRTSPAPIIGLLGIIVVFLIITVISVVSGEKKRSGATPTATPPPNYVGAHVSGLPVVQLASVMIHLLEDRLFIRSSGMDFEIPHSKLKVATAMTHTELVQQQKNVVGRAIVGGVVLGPLGAIVGGISGVGSKEKKKIKCYLIINYLNNNDELSSIVLDGVVLSSAMRFARLINEKVPSKGEVLTL